MSRATVYECVRMIAQLLEPCPDRKIPLLLRLLRALDHSLDPELYAYIYVGVYVANDADDDILTWTGGPGLEGGPKMAHDALVTIRDDLRVLLKYSWEMSGTR